MGGSQSSRSRRSSTHRRYTSPRHRSEVEETDAGFRSRRGKVLRLASWNLENFTIDKANNSTVMEVVCCIILNKRLDLIALQELGSPDALEMICEELNDPQIKGVKACKKWRQGKWLFATSTAVGSMQQHNEYNGFLWHDATGVQLLNSGLLGGAPEPDEEKFSRRPFIGYFKSRYWNFVLISVHLQSPGLHMAELPQLKNELALLQPLAQAIESQGHDKIILLGEFNLDALDPGFAQLRSVGFTNLIPVTVPTNISVSNPKGSKQYDNIWISDAASEWRLNWGWGVVRDGLTHQTYTSGSRNSTLTCVSDHCPIWADFKV